MKTIVFAIIVALGAALVVPAFATPAFAATNSEGAGGSNPYASPMTGRPMAEPAKALLIA